MINKILLTFVLALSLILTLNIGAYAAEAGDTVAVGGMPFGIKFYTEGLLICGVSEVDTTEGNISPGKEAGIKKGDIIASINGEKVDTAADLMKFIRLSEGNAITLDILRDTKKLSIEVQPRFSVSENEYKTGLWIKDGTAGIGTVTYIDKTDNSFAGLGHGVCDTETSKLLKMKKADVCDVIISSVKKGFPDNPGALQGVLSEGVNGYLTQNTDHGVYGIIENNTQDSILEAVIATKNELQEGPADILCTLDDNSIGKYSITIEKIFNNAENTKNFILRVSDETLIDKTGGIVQGMSGSPILQNGKLVGAVTHVLVDDPTRGYGIFIENMLATSN